MHIADLDQGMLGANGIVGGGPPLVCGVGLTAKVKRHRPGRGLLHRRRRLEPGHVPRGAEPRRAPGTCRAIFVVENNGYAEATSSAFHQAGDRRRQARRRLRHARRRRRRLRLLRRPRGRRRGDRARPLRRRPDADRVQGRPLLRPLRGRPADLPRRRTRSRTCARDRDCLDAFARRVTEAGLIERPTLDAIDSDVATLIDEAVRRGQGGARPDARRRAHRRLRHVLGRATHGQDDHLPAGDQRGARARRWSATRPSSSSARTSPAAAGAPGEDDAWGGVLGVTKGLYRQVPGPGDRHADHRVGVSSARRRAPRRPGLRPVAELMFVDFLGVCLDQIFNQAAQVPLHVRRQGRDADGHPRRCSAPASARPRSTRRRCIRSSPTSRG